MRWSVVLLVLALAGVVGGAFLVGRWCVGVAVIFDSVAVGAWALFHDDGQEMAAQPQVGVVTDFREILKREAARP